MKNILQQQQKVHEKMHHICFEVLWKQQKSTTTKNYINKQTKTTLFAIALDMAQ